MEHLRSKQQVCRISNHAPMYFQQIANPASALRYMGSAVINKSVIADKVCEGIANHKLSLWVMRKGERTFTLGITPYGVDTPYGLRVIGECYKLDKYKGGKQAPKRKRMTNAQRARIREARKPKVQKIHEAMAKRNAAEKRARKGRPVTIIRGRD